MPLRVCRHVPARNDPGNLQMQVTMGGIIMPAELILPVSLVMAIIAWTLIFAWYVHPSLRQRTFMVAMTPLLLLNSFRYIGLMFLIPGVTAETLDMRFA